MPNIYLHNPRCSKSRQGIQILEEMGIKFQIREYLKDPLNKKEAEELYSLLMKDYSPKEFTRHKEKIFKELKITLEGINKKNWATLVVENPALIERPILFSNKKVIIGRPPEELTKFK